MNRDEQRDGASDTGSATVLVLAAGALLSMFAVAAGLVATGLVAHRQAVRAADLAALAGAGRSVADADAACSVARVVALANGGVLRACAVDQSSVRVTVTVTVAVSGLLPEISATARAGPRLS
jgi:secretion/DNA translocation related TadE-like protein